MGVWHLLFKNKNLPDAKVNPPASGIKMDIFIFHVFGQKILQNTTVLVGKLKKNVEYFFTGCYREVRVIPARYPGISYPKSEKTPG
jgi:O-glycosyl hydrolase